MRYPVRFDAFSRVALLVLGATPGNSYVEVTPDSVRVAFGLYHRNFPRSEVARATPGPGYWLSRGWRWRPGAIGMIAAGGGVVSIHFRERISMPLLPPLPVPTTRVERIDITVEDPGGLIAEIGAGG
jgi:hypothetical protein